jgi:arabinosyltransferase C
MANYFRWYGVPEAPFGSPYYDVLAVLTNITPASPFVRLPALLAGIVAWLVISREVAPRLGAAVRGNRLALWTGGLVFLAFWLPYNNGLRPEPIVAVGVLLTWCSVERAVATRRLLPAAVAILVGAATLTAGPSGLICFGALVAGARPILQIVIARAKTVGYVA